MEGVAVALCSLPCLKSPLPPLGLRVPEPLNTKAQIRSGALHSDEAGKFLGTNMFGETWAWRKLRGA